MRKIQELQYQNVERFMDSLGAYDRGDTKRVLTRFLNFYLIELSEMDFFNCIFLSTTITKIITPNGQSRNLKAVAGRALSILGTQEGRLGPNWNINDIYQMSCQMIIEDHHTIPPIVLRDTTPNEREANAFKYIHDGCHRSLGYAMLLLQGRLAYSPVSAYLATHESI